MKNYLIVALVSLAAISLNGADLGVIKASKIIISNYTLTMNEEE